MQNKGALKVLVILLAIACAYQLSFTFIAGRVEKKAEEYALQFQPEERVSKEAAYLDSMNSQVVYNLGFIKYTFKQVKEKEINLGLDLKGGMNVMLEIAVEDVVVALANDSKDPNFTQAIVKARNINKTTTTDFITAFAREYNTISGGAPLAAIFNTPDLRGEIKPTSTDEEVVRVLRKQTDNAIASSFNVLRSRIDRFGVTQPNIQRIEGSGRILVELPGVKEPERVRKLLQGTASLEFWATYENPEILPMLQQADALIRQLENARTSTDVTEEGEEAEGETTESAEAEQAPENNALLDELAQAQQDGTVNADELAAIERTNPLMAKLNPLVDWQSGRAYPGAIVGHAQSYDTVRVNAMLNQPQVKALFPRDLKLMWGVKGIIDPQTRTETNVYELYAIRANTRDGKAPLDGGAVVNATPEYAQHGSAALVSMAMNGEGAGKWARLTADNVGRSVAIVLDGYVYSAPRVNEEITGGRSQISGNFTIEEATDLANVLNSGKLPAPARIIQDTVVGPSLGKESIQSSMISFLLAFVLVLLYMIFFYNRAGVVASIALICNVILLFGVLASFGAVLTLPGIAGIVLTMGMAVDANVLIYERVKEELKAGKGLSAAVQAGYKNAMSAIIDANVTTIITSVVLYMFGTGPVQGFATTLFIGIITSFFCAIFITRMLFTPRINKGKNITFYTRLTKNFLANTKANFLKARKIPYLISTLLVVLSIASFFVRGMNYGVDFTGGRAYVVRFDRPVTADEVRERLQLVFADAPGDDANKSFEVKQFGDANQMRIVTQYRADDESDDATSQVEDLLYKSLEPLYTERLTQNEFETTATNPHGIISADKVGASIAHETVRNSFIAVIFSLIAIGIYVIIRFRRWQWGAGSVIALAHDAFLTVGLFSVFHGLLPFTLEVDQSFIAAVLTIIGYSINDKVVIFDRIREYVNLYPKRSMWDNINNAINSTLARTINTSGTTFVTLLAIFLFGGEVIRGFVFALMFGVVMGTLSSIFIATPISYDLMKKADKEGKDKAAAK